jgi:hypothetical protein
LAVFLGNDLPTDLQQQRTRRAEHHSEAHDLSLTDIVFESVNHRVV